MKRPTRGDSFFDSELAQEGTGRLAEIGNTTHTLGNPSQEKKH